MQKLLTHRDILNRLAVTNIKQNKFSEATSSKLNSLLRLIEVHYCNMNTDETKLNGLLDVRFASIIFLFRLAGIPVKTKKISTIYFVYMTTLIICSGSMFIGMFFDVYVHWEGLGHVMTTVRQLITFTNYMWIFSNCR